MIGYTMDAAAKNRRLTVLRGTLFWQTGETERDRSLQKNDFLIGFHDETNGTGGLWKN
ncbi:MAG: hypothetical protein RRZ24_08680 [Clostridia bacterium]